MFASLTAAPPDPILGLTEAFRNDPRSDKINLSVGVYKDASGNTPVLASVKEAEKRLVETQHDKSYLPIDGPGEFQQHVLELVFGPDHEVVQSERAVVFQTPGGTGGLRVAADFLAEHFPDTAMWNTTPTWPNHPSVFAAGGMSVESFPYFSAVTNAIDFDGMLNTLTTIPGSQAVCLHGCCHNPTGIDPTAEQWNIIAEVLRERDALPLIDFAYQGVAEGIEVDRQGLLAVCRPGKEMIVTASFSKNFGLYRERCGALIAVAQNADQAGILRSQLKRTVRTNYSNPPAHGGAVVATILGDCELRNQWESEVAGMRRRINGMRSLFADTMEEKGARADFRFITQQRGMFSFSGLTPMQVDQLRTEHAVYIVGNGRINVAGMTESNMNRLCEAILAVL